MPRLVRRGPRAPEAPPAKGDDIAARLTTATTTSTSKQLIKMLARTAAARAPMVIARRGFSTTRAQFASPYHYPEGPRSNIPFNPLTRFFWLRYWGFMAVGFFAPFGIAVWQTVKNH